MHELLLLGQVPSDQQEQLLKILAGIAGVEPVRVVERHLIFGPKKTSLVKDAPIGASQGVQNQQIQALQGQLKGELFYLQIVGEVVEPLGSEKPRVLSSQDGSHDAVTRGEDAGTAGDAPKHYKPSYSWSLCFYDLPEVSGRRAATSRMIARVEILDGDPIGFMDALGYRFLSEYALEGHRIIHNNIILLLHRLLRVPKDGKGRLGSSGPDISGRAPLTPLDARPDAEAWTSIDPSGAWILQASVRVQDGSKPEPMTLATNELLAFQEVIKGVVDLEPGNRLAMDTRVR